MRVRLNLATKPLETHRRFLAAAGAIGFAAIALLIPLSLHVYKVRQADAQMRSAEEKVRQEASQYQQQRTQLEAFFNQPENAKLNERAAFLNSIMDTRSFNWTQMFMDLEKILPPGVRIMNIEPVQKNGRIEVKISIGAVSDEAKLKFLHALEDSKVFTQIALSLQRVPDRNTTKDSVLVELTAAYASS